MNYIKYAFSEMKRSSRNEKKIKSQEINFGKIGMEDALSCIPYDKQKSISMELLNFPEEEKPDIFFKNFLSGMTAEEGNLLIGAIKFWIVVCIVKVFWLTVLWALFCIWGWYNAIEANGIGDFFSALLVWLVVFLLPSTLRGLYYRIFDGVKVNLLETKFRRLNYRIRECMCEKIFKREPYYSKLMNWSLKE